MSMGNGWFYCITQKKNSIFCCIYSVQYLWVPQGALNRFRKFTNETFNWYTEKGEVVSGGGLSA